MNLEELKAENEELRKINNNLMRILKEKANAKRGIKPKKEHSGYIILNQEESELRLQKQGTWKELKCWKIRIQSPIDCLLELDKKLILQGIEDTFNLKQDLIFLKGYLKLSEFNDLWELVQTEHVNFIMKSKYKSNNVSGLWEVDCWIPFFYDALQENKTDNSKFREKSKKLDKITDKRIAQAKEREEEYKKIYQI